jgi:hypothetical protein
LRFDHYPEPVTTKFVVLEHVPPAFLTFTGPVKAPLGTGKVSDSGLMTVTVESGATDEPMATASTFEKPVPVTAIVVPTGPDVGVKYAIVGAATVTAKFAALCAVPPAVLTLIGAVTVPDGTGNSSDDELSTVTVDSGATTDPMDTA